MSKNVTVSSDIVLPVPGPEVIQTPPEKTVASVVGALHRDIRKA